MYAGPMRLLRAFTVSATCVALSLAAHLVGAGSEQPVLSAVGVVGLLMTAMLLTLVLASLSGRRWTLGRSLVALALGQVGLNAIFSVLLSSHAHQGPTEMSAIAGGASMALAHGCAAALIGVGIAVSDSALDTYFSLASSLVGSGAGVLTPWHLAALLPLVDAVAAGRGPSRTRRFALSERPRILTDLVVLQCLSRRGPPELALAS